MSTPVTSTYNFANATGPFAPVQTNGGATGTSLAIVGSGASYSAGRLSLPVNCYLDGGNVGINLPTSSDLALTQSPASMTLEWTGILPADDAPLVSLQEWNKASMNLCAHWQPGRVRVYVEREGSPLEMIESISGYSMTSEEVVGVRYDDNPGGAGGTITFLRNGAPFGPVQNLAYKARVTPQCQFQCNASLGNTSDSALQQVKSIALTVKETQDGGTGGPDDLTVYGDPGTRFPLDIDMQGASGNYTLSVPSGLSLVKRVVTPTPTDKSSSYVLDSNSSSFTPAQTNGGVTANSLTVVGTGTSYSGGYFNLPAGTYLSAGAAGITLPTTNDPAITQTPLSFTLEYTGIVPVGSAVLVSLYDYNKACFQLNTHWQAGRVSVNIDRGTTNITLLSDTGLSNSAEERIGVRYDDDVAGPGGTVTFLRNGVPFGAPQSIGFKLRMTPAAELQCNASIGNTSNAQNLQVKSVRVTLNEIVGVESFVPVTSGTVSAADIEELYVDALAVGTAQPPRTISYTPAGGGTASTVTVIVGPLDIAAGVAYRAVLEDWSSGAAVSHANMLVMTRPARQNCQFEDSVLGANQPRWMECLPQGAVPVIGGIAYYCEAVRMDDYVQFQFGYDWTAAEMPSNPFGDPSGKESYMVPHKWRIEDKNGVLLGMIERPDGGPLNGTDVPGIFEGSYDGRDVPITNATDKWYPRGTVRSGIIWRSKAPDAYDQTFINTHLPRYDVTIGYASHLGYSVNGGDMRLGGAGQLNGFANCRSMPYEPTDYATLQTQVGVTSDPWKGLYHSDALMPNAAVWLKYTPFNQSGRSPVTGPGGARDDRAAFPEPVGQYMYDVAATRPHDGRPWATIALDYMTAYASDPYHAFEGGRCVPVFKGVHANRDAGLRNHYYGYGEASRPANRSWYIEGGRPYEFADGYSPLTCKVPRGGSAARKPYFGTNQIDLLHAHQFPHWGSLLWKTPEFAFLGHRFSDQARLYENIILNSGNGYPGMFAERSAAWQFLHRVMCWKTGSKNSDRLYSRAETLDFVVKDFEAFSDRFKTSTPGFDNPPANIMTNGQIDQALAIYAATHRFGPCVGGDNDSIAQHDFYIGYWLTALAIGERLGFNAAVRAASAKAGAVIDWLIAQHRKRIVGRINDAARANTGSTVEYYFILWSGSALASSGGNVAALPQNYADVEIQNGTVASWDIFTTGGATYTKDGQAMDQIIAGPSVLRAQLGQSGSDLANAEATATGWRNQKKTEQEALGAFGAGSTWFRYLQAANNPAIS